MTCCTTTSITFTTILSSLHVPQCFSHLWHFLCFNYNSGTFVQCDPKANLSSMPNKNTLYNYVLLSTSFTLSGDDYSHTHCIAHGRYFLPTNNKCCILIATYYCLAAGASGLAPEYACYNMTNFLSSNMHCAYPSLAC